MGSWQGGTIDSRTWGLGQQPSHQYVVREGVRRLLLLGRIRDPRDANPYGPLRPSIWPDAPDDPRSGLRAIEQRWLSSASAAGGEGTSAAGSRRRGAPDPSTDAPWMHPAPPRPLPKRARLASGAAAQPSAPPPPPEPPPPQAPQPDTLDLAARLPAPAVPWAHVWRVVGDRDLDRSQRILAWRILHGRLRVGAFLRHIGTGTRAAHLCPHAVCHAAAATYTHIFVTCPLAGAVVAWVCATWAALTGGAGPPASPDLFLADDRRAWSPAPALNLLWQRVRLAMLAALLAAHRAGHAHPTTLQTARGVAARILAQLRAACQRDWVLVSGGLRRAGGAPSAWYRGRDPHLTREAFQERWCHRGVLCSLTAGDGEPLIHWSTTVPVPLPT